LIIILIVTIALYRNKEYEITSIIMRHVW
jgi:hypothetical protein